MSLTISEITIRKYLPKDKEAIKSIACRTAGVYPRLNRQLIGDLLTAYYTDYEPQHLLIAEWRGDVGGYLAGCSHTTRSRLIKSLITVPRAVSKALFRGNISAQELNYFIVLMEATFRRRDKGDSSPPEGYPAHFHINLKEGLRGRGLGAEMVKKFLKALKKEDVAGVHVRVKERNGKAQKFFKALGFTYLKRYPMVAPKEEGYKDSYTVIYGKRL